VSIFSIGEDRRRDFVGIEDIENHFADPYTTQNDFLIHPIVCDQILALYADVGDDLMLYLRDYAEGDPEATRRVDRVLRAAGLAD
jgi:hypothetical protein